MNNTVFVAPPWLRKEYRMRLHFCTRTATKVTVRDPVVNNVLKAVVNLIGIVLDVRLRNVWK